MGAQGQPGGPGGDGAASSSSGGLLNRTSNLLANKSFTDVTFIVGPPSHSKKYVGHRVLLAMTSPVFEAMFYGGGTGDTSSNRVIRIPDLAPVGFENLLRYAYTDSLNLNSVEDAMLTAAGAKKYLLPHLLRECLLFIEKNLSPSSATSVYEFSQVIFSPVLALKALQMMDRNTCHVISHRSFCSIQTATLELLLQRRYLNLFSEYALFSRVICWALQEAKRRSLMTANSMTDWSVVRLILQEAPILKSIRFLSMSPEEFTRVLASTSNMSPSNTVQSFMDGGSCGGSCGADQPGKKGGATGSSETTIQESASEFPDQMFKNSLISLDEAIAIYMNLAIPGIKEVPRGKFINYRLID